MNEHETATTSLQKNMILTVLFLGLILSLVNETPKSV